MLSHTYTHVSPSPSPQVTYSSPPVTVLVSDYTPGKTFNLTGLEPNTQYIISVIAATAGGEGPASESEIVMTVWGSTYVFTVSC